VAERHLFIAHGLSTQSDAYRSSVDGMLSPAVMNQIFVQNRDFCRAMLCISAAYAVMRCVCVSVCVSVCLSVTFLTCVKTNKHIIKISSLSVATPF